MSNVTIKKLTYFLEKKSIRAEILDDIESLEVFGVSNKVGITVTDHKKSKDLAKYQLVEKGDFAYNPYRINVGSIGLVPDGIKGLVSPAYVVFKTNENLLPELLLDYLRSNEGLFQIGKYARGTVRKTLKFEDLCKIEMPIPSISKQNSILKKKESVEIEVSELKTELTYQQTLIKKLRQQILQEAIEGKLTAEWRKRFFPLPRGRTAKQGGDKYEYASVLLERIIAEKNQMIKDKKIKPHKTIPPISCEDKPFPLPPGWVWCRLGDIALINPRNYVSDDIEVGFTPMPLVSASFCDSPKFEKRRWADVKKGFTHFANNDVIVAKITPCFENSKAGVVENYPNGIGAGTTELHVIRKLTLELNSSYIYFSLKTTQFLQNGKKLMTGAVGQKRVPKEYIENLLFSLPPIAEQKTIVVKVEKLIALCDQLEAKIAENKPHAKQLIRAVLKEALAQK